MIVWLVSSLLLCSGASLVSMNDSDIYVSTKQGGKWYDGSTWTGGEAPPCTFSQNASAQVSIMGPVVYGESSCELKLLEIHSTKLTISAAHNLPSSMSMEDLVFAGKQSSLFIAGSGLSYNSVEAQAAVFDSSVVATINGGQGPVGSRAAVHFEDLDVPKGTELHLESVLVSAGQMDILGQVIVKGAVDFNGVIRLEPRGTFNIFGQLWFAEGSLDIEGGLRKGGGRFILLDTDSEIIVAVPGIIKNVFIQGQIDLDSNDLSLQNQVSIEGRVRFKTLKIKSFYEGTALTVAPGAFLYFDKVNEIVLGSNTNILADSAHVTMTADVTLFSGLMTLQQSNITIMGSATTVRVEPSATLVLRNNRDYSINSNTFFAIGGTMQVIHQGVFELRAVLRLVRGGASVHLGTGVSAMNCELVYMSTSNNEPCRIEAPHSMLNFNTLQLLGGYIDAGGCSVEQLYLFSGANELHCELQVTTSANLAGARPPSAVNVNGSFTLTGKLSFSGIRPPSDDPALVIAEALVLSAGSELSVASTPGNDQDLVLATFGEVSGSFDRVFVPMGWGISMTKHELILTRDPDITQAPTFLLAPTTAPTPAPDREKILTIGLSVAGGLLLIAVVTVIIVCSRLKHIRNRGRFLDRDVYGYEDDTDYDDEAHDSSTSYSPLIMDQPYSSNLDRTSFEGIQ